MMSIWSLSLVLGLAGLAVGTPAPAITAANPAQPSPSLAEIERLYRDGQSFTDFLAAAKARRQTWLDNYERADVPADLLRRAQAVAGRWRLLVVAVDRCGDSANSIPYLARFAERAGHLDMRIVTPEAGKAVQEAHRTPEGKAVTPTVVLLDKDGRTVGCFIERPFVLQRWVTENKAKIDRETLTRKEMAWYEIDAGRSAIREIVEQLEAAAAGTPMCR